MATYFVTSDEFVTWDSEPRNHHKTRRSADSRVAELCEIYPKVRLIRFENGKAVKEEKFAGMEPLPKSALREIVEQGIDGPSVLGRLACNLRSDKPVEQRHHDDRKLKVRWRERLGHWRCTIYLDATTDLCLTEFDVHDDGSVRVESWEPCSVTVDPKMGIMCLTRFKPSR